MLFVFNAEAQEYMIVKEESSANWTGYGEVGGFKQSGTISLLDSKIITDNGAIQKGKLVFNAKDIQHENKDLEKHLKAKDFFFTRKYPEIIFELESITGSQAQGTLSIRGKSNNENIACQINYDGDFIIVSGKAEIDRTKYDIKYNSSSYFQDLGNYAIKNVFDLEFNLVFRRL